MSIFGRLFGTQKTIDNITDKDNGLLSQVGGWVGRFNYTDEEKALADADTRQWGLKQLEALEPFKIVQRILAFAAAFFWIFVGINVVISIWVHALTEHSDKVIDARTDLMTFAMSDYTWWPVALVFALYFGGGVVSSLKNKG